MLRLAFDFIITWRETRTRPNAYIVPDNALFWLRDLTRGREEHIFFMQNRRQKFPTF